MFEQHESPTLFSILPFTFLTIPIYPFYCHRLNESSKFYVYVLFQVSALSRVCGGLKNSDKDCVQCSLLSILFYLFM